MGGLTKPIDVTRPEDYQMRDGSKVLSLAKYKNGDILVLYGGYYEEPDHIRVNPDGKRWSNSDKGNPLDLIEKPKKMWSSLYNPLRIGVTRWYPTRSEASINVGGLNKPVGYITCTDPKDFSTYELVPLEGEI